MRVLSIKNIKPLLTKQSPKILDIKITPIDLRPNCGIPMSGLICSPIVEPNMLS